MTSEARTPMRPMCDCTPPDGITRNHANGCALFDVRAAFRQALAARDAQLAALRVHHVSQDCHPGTEYPDACTEANRQADLALLGKAAVSESNYCPHGQVVGRCTHGCGRKP